MEITDGVSWEAFCHATILACDLSAEADAHALSYRWKPRQRQLLQVACVWREVSLIILCVIVPKKATTKRALRFAQLNVLPLGVEEYDKANCSAAGKSGRKCVPTFSFPLHLMMHWNCVLTLSERQFSGGKHCSSVSRRVLSTQNLSKYSRHRSGKLNFP